MRSVDENVEALSRTLLSEAKTETEQILADAKAKADAIRERTQEQAAAEREQILDRARQEAERNRSQAIATTQLKARTMELEHREKLLDNVFTTARQQLSTIQQWSDYERIALSLLREALHQLNASDVVVQADAYTQKFLTDKALKEISKELKINLKLGEPLEQGTGVIVETSDGHVKYDNTLETRMSRLQNALRSPVNRILNGVSL
ncbi:MAG TPA: V-type ATP synthase subunit E family protein [Longilinea sp.]|nr:V-type ATP synthase subunit E family protein [Longilinea sp.]